jgi:hypothetical protein
MKCSRQRYHGALNTGRPPPSGPYARPDHRLDATEAALVQITQEGERIHDFRRRRAARLTEFLTKFIATPNATPSDQACGRI